MDNYKWLIPAAAVGSMVVIILVIIFVSVMIALYVLQAVGLYRMAVQMEYDSPWLAWVPLANIYLMFILPRHPLYVLVMRLEIISRERAFWMYMGGSFGTATLVMILVDMQEIPVIGLAAAWCSVFLEMGIIFANVVFRVPMLYDLFEYFMPERTARIFSIVGVIVPQVLPVFCYIAGRQRMHRPASEEIIVSSREYGHEPEEEEELS